MKIYTLFYCLFIFIFSCNQKQKVVLTNMKSSINKIDTLTNIKTQKIDKKSDSIPYVDSDKIDKKSNDSFLKIIKLSNGYLSLEYKLKSENINHHFKIKYIDYSDIVFPDNGVGIIGSKSFKLKEYFIYNDNILILPTIGVNNLLSTYIINLKKEEVIGNDIRTSLNLFWIRNRKNNIEFIVSDTPEIKDDNNYYYVLNKYKLTNSELIFIKKDTLVLKSDTREDLKKEFKMIRNLF